MIGYLHGLGNLWEVVCMFKYVKTTNFPIDIKKKDLKMARYLLTQFGGANGELAAALRYFSQKFTMPDDYGRALLNDISTEELGHCEMIASMVAQLTKNATVKEMEEAGLGAYYADFNKAVYPVNASGVPFTATYFAATADPLADLMEDMAAEQKARAVYENLIDLTDDEDIIRPLLFLRQREIVHFNRFKELYEYYKSKGY